MIKPKDLRVGNHYEYNSGEMWVLNIIDADDILYCHENNEDFNAEYRPILVTGETMGTIKQAIKEPFDWAIEIKGLQRQYKSMKISVNIGLIFISSGDINNARKNDELVCVHNADIHGPLYLHKLQNLYNLLSNGEELEFKA